MLYILHTKMQLVVAMCILWRLLLRHEIVCWFVCLCVCVNQQKLLVKRRSERRLGFVNEGRPVPTESLGKAKSEICFCGAHGRSPSKLLLNPFSTRDLLPSPSLSLISDTALTFTFLQQFESSVCHDHLDLFIHTNYLLQGETRWFNLLAANFSWFHQSPTGKKIWPFPILLSTTQTKWH